MKLKTIIGRFVVRHPDDGLEASRAKLLEDEEGYLLRYKAALAEDVRPPDGWAKDLAKGRVCPQCHKAALGHGTTRSASASTRRRCRSCDITWSLNPVARRRPQIPKKSCPSCNQPGRPRLMKRDPKRRIWGCDNAACKRKFWTEALE